MPPNKITLCNRRAGLVFGEYRGVTTGSTEELKGDTRLVVLAPQKTHPPAMHTGGTVIRLLFLVLPNQQHASPSSLLKQNNYEKDK